MRCRHISCVSLVLGLVVLSSDSLHAAPKLGWGECLNGSSVYRCAPTGDGGVFVSGLFSGTVDFDPGPGVTNLTATGAHDAYLARYDAGGNFVWVSVINGSAGCTVRNWGVAAGESGMVYVAGYFTGTATFGPGQAGQTSLTSGDFGTGPGLATSLYIAQYDGASGQFQWVTGLIGSANTLVYDVALDSSENVIVTGQATTVGTNSFVSGTGTTYPTPFSVASACLFLVKLNNAGVPTWVDMFAGLSATQNGRGVQVDGQDNIYFAGGLTGTADFDPGPGTYYLSSPTGSLGVTYVCKLTPAGAFSWALVDQGPPVAGSPDHAACLAVDTNGNSYVTTYGTLYRTQKKGGSGTLAKIDANGNWVWIKSLSVNSMAVAVDSSGNVYVTALDQGTTKFNSAGTTVWSTSTKFAPNYTAKDMAVDSAGNLFVVGSFRSAFNISPGPGTFTLTPPGTSAVPYFVKWTQ